MEFIVATYLGEYSSYGEVAWVRFYNEGKFAIWVSQNGSWSEQGLEEVEGSLTVVIPVKWNVFLE